MTSFYALMAEHARSNRPPPPTPDIEERRRRDEARIAHELEQRRARIAEQNRVLAPGTSIVAPVLWLKYHDVEIVSDPGPASNPDRKIKIRRCGAQFVSEIYEVRRERVNLKVAETTPPPGVTGARDAARKSASRKAKA